MMTETHLNDLFVDYDAQKKVRPGFMLLDAETFLSLCQTTAALWKVYRAYRHWDLAYPGLDASTAELALHKTAESIHITLREDRHVQNQTPKSAA